MFCEETQQTEKKVKSWLSFIGFHLVMVSLVLLLFAQPAVSMNIIKLPYCTRAVKFEHVSASLISDVAVVCMEEQRGTGKR